MKERSARGDPPLDLAELGLQEVEQRLEVSPLITADPEATSEPLDREGTSCSCKINDDRPQDDGGEGDG